LTPLPLISIGLRNCDDSASPSAFRVSACRRIYRLKAIIKAKAIRLRLEEAVGGRYRERRLRIYRVYVADLLRAAGIGDVFGSEDDDPTIAPHRDGVARPLVIRDGLGGRGLEGGVDRLVLEELAVVL
jgi:hypothetical protein